MLKNHEQGFIQAVLVMSVFERRLSFQMLHFMKKLTQDGSTMKVGVWRHCKLHGGSMGEP